MSEFQFADLFELLVDADPHRACVVAGAGRHSYGELDARANRLAHHLTTLGVTAGDHVAVHAMNRMEWIEAIFACWKIRAVFVNVNYRYVEAELRYLYRDSDAVVSIIEPEWLPRLDAIKSDLPRLGCVIVLGEQYEAALAASSAERGFGPRSPDDVYLLYTGGTTGRPKGVVWRHEDAFFATAGGGRLLGPPITSPEEIAANMANPGLKMMATSPIMHGGGQWLMFFTLYAGGTFVLSCERSFDAGKILDLAARERVVSLGIIGDAMGRPLATEIAKGSWNLSSLVSFGNGGAPLSPAVKNELKAALPHAMVRDSFGASETGATGGTTSLVDGKAKFQMTAGVTVLDEDFRPVVPGSGSVGKLARTGHIPLGYWKDPEKTAATFPVVDGVRWVIPGDFATLEVDGTIIVLGRGSVVINSGGEKIFPDEVEFALKEHPAVHGACVVGLSDEHWGERAVGLVQLRDGHRVDPSELLAHCRTLVADFKVPKQLWFVDALPVTEVGKPDHKSAKVIAQGLA